MQYPYINIPGSETVTCKNWISSIKRNIKLLLPYGGHLWEEHGIVFIPKSGKPRTINIPSARLYKWEIENMNQAIIEGTPTLISLNESRDRIRTIEALYESAKQHLPVTIK